MSIVRSIVLTSILSILAGALGAWGGIKYGLAQNRRAPLLHDLVHEELSLSEYQVEHMARLEHAHAVKRAALQARMRAANAELANAFKTQHRYTKNTQEAIDQLVVAAGELQKETILHVIAMGALLTPEQAQRFDEVVVNTLTQEGT